MTQHYFEIPTDPLEFADASEAELGYDPVSLKRNYYEWRADDDTPRVGVYEVLPRLVNSDETEWRPETTIVMQASHDYRLEPLWMRRMDIIATRMNARVIGVETPGTTGLLRAYPDGSWDVYDNTDKLPGDKSTREQYVGAVRGDFRSHAAMQLDAIQATAGLDGSGRVVLLGESMGATLAVDTLQEAYDRGLNVTDIILHEMVNTFPGRKLNVPRRLMSVLPGPENDRRNEYIKENKDNGHPMAAFEMGSDEPDNPTRVAKQKKLDDARKSLKQQGFATIVNGLGVARGRQEDLVKVKRYYGEEAPKFTLVRGRESLATSPSDYKALAGALYETGAKVTMYEVTDKRNKQPIGHAHTVSLGRQAIIADELKLHIG